MMDILKGIGAALVFVGKTAWELLECLINIIKEIF